MPKDLQFNDTDLMIHKAVEHIEDLREQMKTTQISIGKYDRERFSDIEFSSSKSSTSPPFFVWHNSDFKQDIEKLLQGQEIVVKADITKGLKENAVKFNEIGIHFKAAKDTIQTQIDAELEHFGVTLAMIGNNYYRCGSRIYFISVDDNIVLDYTMKKGADGKPSVSNEVYDKISGKNCFLSPYAMWSIKLRKISENEENFDNLKKFTSEIIDLELIGHGQYLKEEGLISKEICNEKLDEYYNLENVAA